LDTSAGPSHKLKLWDPTVGEDWYREWDCDSLQEIFQWDGRLYHDSYPGEWIYTVSSDVFMEVAWIKVLHSYLEQTGDNETCSWVPVFERTDHPADLLQFPKTTFAFEGLTKFFLCLNETQVVLGLLPVYGQGNFRVPPDPETGEREYEYSFWVNPGSDLIQVFLPDETEITNLTYTGPRWDTLDGELPPKPGELRIRHKGIPSTSWGDVKLHLQVRNPTGGRTYPDSPDGSVLPLGLIEVDLDIDSDNNNGTGNPERSPEEDEIEEEPGLHGKLVFINDDGVDERDDLIPMKMEILPASLYDEPSQWRLDYNNGMVNVWVREDSGILDYAEPPITDPTTKTFLEGVDPVTYQLIPKTHPFNASGGGGFPTCYIEGTTMSMSPGDVLIALEYSPRAHPWCDSLFEGLDRVRVTVTREIDLDVDSDNHGGSLLVDDPEEDLIEDADPTLGAYVFVNRDNDDIDSGDRIMDYGDGFNHNNSTPTPPATPPVDDDDITENEDDFVEMYFRVPTGIDLDVARVRVTYDSSPPSEASISGDPLVVEPGEGWLRIWKRGGGEMRNKHEVDFDEDADGEPDGDFVNGGDDQTTVEYDASDLGLTNANRQIRLWLEGIEPGGKRIVFEMDPDGPGPAEYICQDAVRVMAIELDLDIFRLGGTEVVQEEIEDIEGSITRVLNPNEGETDKIGEATGICLRLDPGVTPRALALHYYLSLKAIGAYDDRGQVHVYKRLPQIDPILVLDNTASSPTDWITDAFLFEAELDVDYWMEFEGGGIVELVLSATHPDTTDITFSDSVRACGIACDPKPGSILFVHHFPTPPPPLEAGPSLNDYTRDAAQTIADAVSLAEDNDNVVIADGEYQESMTSETAVVIDDDIVLAGLGLRWVTNPCGIAGGERWRDEFSPYTPNFRGLPVVGPPQGEKRTVVRISGGGDVALAGVRIVSGSTEGLSIEDGAGVDSLANALAVHACLFMYNKAIDYGGGLCHRNAGGSSLSLVDCYFGGNYAQDGGGGVALKSSGTVDIKRTHFDNNSSRRGDSGVAAEGGGLLALESNAVIHAATSFFSGNYADHFGTTRDENFLDGAYGGACSFTGNPTVTVENVDFLANWTVSAANRAAGGAVSLRGTAGVPTAEFTNCHLQGNSASGPGASRATGGAIYLTSAALSLENCVFGGDDATPEANWVACNPPLGLPCRRPSMYTCSQNYGLDHVPINTCYGGAIAGHYNVTLSATDTLFKNNWAWFFGGAVGFVGEREAISGETCCQRDAGVQSVDCATCDFEDNWSIGHGGGMAGASKFSGGVITSCRFSTNNVKGRDDECLATGSYDPESEGEYNAVTADGGAIAYQAALEGNLVLQGCQFVENTAQGGGGACKHGGGGHASYQDCLFSGNKAGGCGGALRLSTGAAVDVDTSEFYENKSGQFLPGIDGFCDEVGHGGAVSVHTASIDIDDSRFEGNKAGMETDVPRDGGCFDVRNDCLGHITRGKFGVSDAQTELTVWQSHILNNGAFRLAGLVYGEAGHDDMVIEFDRCTLGPNASVTRLNIGPPLADPDDPVFNNPAYASIYEQDLLDHKVDGIYLKSYQDCFCWPPRESRMPTVTLRLLASVIRANYGSEAVAAFLVGHNGNISGNFYHTSFDGWPVGVVSRGADIPQMQNCEFKYAIQQFPEVKDVMVLNPEINEQLTQKVLVQSTLFAPHPGATGILVASDRFPPVSPEEDTDITVGNSFFDGRQLADPDPQNPPEVANNGGVVVLVHIARDVQAQANYWDDVDGPFSRGHPNEEGSFASRDVNYADYLGAPPSPVGPVGPIGAP
jgi:hypothetical protein